MEIISVRNGPGPHIRTGKGRWFVGLAASAAGVILVCSVTGQPAAHAAEATVGLGTAGTYSVAGGQAVTNTGPTTLNGDLGVSPGTAITGFPPGIVAGSTHAGDAEAAQAQSDLTLAYDDAAARTATATVAGDLVGQTLLPGVYKSAGALDVSGALTLDGQGDRNSVFIFQVASELTTASASSIVLTNGAQACNIYWQVGSSATLGTTSTFKGTILALTSVSVTNGTSVEGRALARNGQVSLDTNVFTMPGCLTAIAPSPSATTPATTNASPADTTSAAVAPRGSGERNQGMNIDTAARQNFAGFWPLISGAVLVAGLVGAGILNRTKRRATLQQR